MGGATYGYPVRAGPQARSESGAEPLSENDTLPVRISGTIERGTIRPSYPVIAYKNHQEGDAIAGGFVYSGSSLPALQDKLVFGDITTGRIWYADLSGMFGADDGDSGTVAADPRDRVESSRACGGDLPGAGRRGLDVARWRSGGRLGGADMRFAEDDAGEVYVLTKSDEMVRRIDGAT